MSLNTTATKSWSAPKSPKGRIHPTDVQLAALSNIYKPSGYASNKRTLSQGVEETGLPEKWIRKWLEQKRRYSKVKSTRADEEISTSAKLSTQTSCAADSNQDSAVHVESDHHHGTYSSVIRRGHFHSLALDGLPHASSSKAYVTGPGSSFMVPFNASFRNTVAPAELSTALSLPFQNELQLRSLIQSPSLGYIPVAFPMTFVPMDIQGRESSRAAPDHSVFPSSVSQPLVPIIPAFPLYPTQAPATDSHSSNMAYLSQLLFEASDPVPLEAARPSELSGYLTALGQRPASVMSFDPSMFSHSTNVLANESVNFMYHPPPVSFKTRYSDLAALTKRIRAAFAESVHLAERGMDGNAQSPVVTQAHMWASGK